jgi:hypothetical protein
VETFHGLVEYLHEQARMNPGAASITHHLLAPSLSSDRRVRCSLALDCVANIRARKIGFRKLSTVPLHRDPAGCAKAALAAAKKRGKKLGGYRGAKLTRKIREAGTATMARNAATRAADLAPIIRELQASGATSLTAIAAALNERGITTARGRAWTTVQVDRVLDRIAAAEAR